jgi:hypothetical protein
VSSGKPSEADGPRCVIAELAAGRSLAVDTELVGDGGDAGCEVRRELHFFVATNTAYDIWTKRCESASTVERHVKRCQMLTTANYVSCLESFDATRASTDGISCSLPQEWTSECIDVDAPSCP